MSSYLSVYVIYLRYFYKMSKLIFYWGDGQISNWSVFFLLLNVLLILKPRIKTKSGLGHRGVPVLQEGLAQPPQGITSQEPVMLQRAPYPYLQPSSAANFIQVIAFSYLDQVL